MPSIVTSLYQRSHGVTGFSTRLPAAAVTLAEVFREAGYATIAFSSVPFTGKFNNRHQGYDTLLDAPPLPGAPPRPGTPPLNPARFILGIVKRPVVTTLEWGLPVIVPYSALDATATLAGPPRVCPASELASRKMKSPAPDTSSAVPNNTKTYTYVAATAMGALNRQWVVKMI